LLLVTNERAAQLRDLSRSEWKLTAAAFSLDSLQPSSL
jgi:hypothetical protein